MPNLGPSDLRPWPSIEQLLVKWLPTQVGHHVSAESWNEYTDMSIPGGNLPLILVDRIAGSDYFRKIDRPVIDVDVFGATRKEAQDLAEAVRFALTVTLPGQIIDGAVFTRCRTIVGPRSLAHGNPDVRRYAAEYELVLHLTPAA